jgi:hypothetical protein
MTWEWKSREKHAAPPQPDSGPFWTTTTSMASSSSNTALKSFSLANDVLTVSPQDEIYKFDVERNKKINRDAPWTKESVRSGA